MKKIAHVRIFSFLANNAFEFFKDALDSIEEKPKHALIFFYTGIELIFKARLALVNPMWILQEPSHASDEIFASGKFKSVNLATAFARLRMLKPDEAIDNNTQFAFNKIRTHRNRIIHYAVRLDKEIEDIARDLFLGWYHTHQLFQTQWKTCFAGYKKKIHQIDQKLFTLEKYLEHIYSLVKGECHGFKECECCNFKAFNGTWCKVCGYRIPSRKEDLDEILSACCGECYSYETAKRTEYGFHCSACGHNFKGYDTVCCEYCGQPWIGLDEAPDYLSGCEFCDGRLGQND